jgi:hypothetical protein
MRFQFVFQAGAFAVERELRDSDILWLKSKKLWLLDMDGATCVEGNPLKGAAQPVERIISLGARHVFVTNNSSKSAEEHKLRLNSMGIIAGGRKHLHIDSSRNPLPK